MKYNLLLSIALLLTACGSDSDEPTPVQEPEPAETGIHTVKAPLYWSVYEYCWMQNQQGVSDASMDITEAQWDEIIDWVATELKPYGYDMICTDGFIPMIADDESGFMTRYGSMPLKTLVSKCEARGLRLGIYDNPLWIHGADNTVVPGTQGITFGDLKYRTGDNVENRGATDKWFSWAVASHEGTREYIDAFFKHFSDLGVKFIRMDFLSWYEDGKDRGMGTVGRGYGRAVYEQALQYICESAQRYGVFTSLVMPHLYEKASLESRYGNMVRIVADTGNGGWAHFSANDRGKTFGTWPNCNNMFDGFIKWSEVSGRNKVILDGDFTRLNTFSSDAERQSVISLQMMAGGPIAVADQPSTVGDCVRFYQNEELLALNRDGFAGQPLSRGLWEANSQIWYGKMSDGSWIVGLFNRDNTPQSRKVKLSDIGCEGKWKVRDLWLHADEGEADQLDVTLAAHSCKIVKLTK